MILRCTSCRFLPGIGAFPRPSLWLSVTLLSNEGTDCIVTGTTGVLSVELSLLDDCGLLSIVRNFILAEARPRWTTLHPDNWTVLEVAEWVEHVAEEYKLIRQVKVKLASIFFDVDGRRLSAMTLRDFEDLDPENGNLLHTVFHDIVSDGRLDQLGEQPDEARTLTPINEVDSRCAVEHEEQDTWGDLAGHDTEGARGGQMSPHSAHGFPDLPNEQTTSRHHHHQHQRPPPSSGSQLR